MIKPLVESGEILDWEFEKFTLKLAQDTRYTPDFFVVKRDQTAEFHEVKVALKSGAFLAEDDAKVKIKVASEMFPWFGFVMCGKKPKSVGGGWQYKIFGENVEEG